MNKISILLLFFILLISANAYADEKLLFSIDLIRHGDRTPGSQIPTSYINWKEGQGELTETGINQEKRLGEQLRIKYTEQSHLLPKIYNSDTIYVRSTDKSRTIKSADALLSGLYPSSYRKPENAKISIHVVPVNDDQLLIVKPSKNIFAIINRYLENHRFWKSKTDVIQDKLDYWSKDTGLSLTNPEQLDQLADNLYVRKLHHIPLPNGISLVDADEIISLSNSIIIHDFKLKEVTNPTGQEFIKTITNYLNQAIHNSTSLKYVLLSGHDASIMCVMNTLGSPLETMPPYAARLNFSLIENDNNYYVKVSYNDKPVFIPACKSNTCTLNQFYRLTI